MDGIILVDKPAGITSFGVVARVRRLLSQAAGKKVKVGHTGTLDPFATGLMIIVVGIYCKRAQLFSKLDKTYEATICLGATSSTGDIEGKITPVSSLIPERLVIDQTLTKFRGTITQTPPIYSAIKINGQRAYKLARQGAALEMPKRLATISKLELTGYNYPFINIICDVSRGTYIRSLAEDIGVALGTGAYCSALRRTRVGKYHIADALRLKDDITADQVIKRIVGENLDPVF